MRKFIVERSLPGAGNLSAEELQAISQSFCDVINEIGKPHHWLESFIAEDKIYSIHIAENERVIREHASVGKFPVNTIAEIKAIIDPVTCGQTIKQH